MKMMDYRSHNIHSKADWIGDETATSHALLRKREKRQSRSFIYHQFPTKYGLLRNDCWHETFGKSGAGIYALPNS